MRQWSPAELIRFSNNYWGICALHAAVELDVFTPLRDGPMTIADLGVRLNCSPRGIKALIPALCALSLLQKNGESVALTPVARECLCRGEEGYIGHIINHHRQLMPGWARLGQAVRKGAPTRERMSFAEDDEREHFLMGMYNMASVRADRVLKAVDFSGRHCLLDLGGGPGAYAVRFCQANPGLQAVIFDLPTSRRFAEQVVRKSGLEARISFAPGNFFEDPLPEGVDVVWMSHILHGTGDAEARQLVAKAMALLPPGGQILIQEFVLDDAQDGPLFPALFGLNMLSGTPTGKAFTEGELKALLDEAGGEHVRRIFTSDEDGTGIIVAEKPGA
ncbi:MAG TPA: methyltransferase [Candidatus Avidesulfovibrio excrementigallinarum]|nr:methyltransferase [Candidatus Avidesulfovibrio excrementigallinarum]